jgi:signal transduction histidine kinase
LEGEEKVHRDGTAFPGSRRGAGRFRPGAAAALLLLLLSASLLAAACGSSPLASRLDRGREHDWSALEGPFQSIMCPDPSCTVEDQEGGAWTTQMLGPEGIEEGLPHREGVGWFRFSFDLSDPAAYPRAALLITRPSDSEELFLNGVPVTLRGSSAGEFATFPNGPRLYPVPPGVLRSGSNELRMRVLFASKSASIMKGPLLLGDRTGLELEQDRLLRPILAMETAFLTLFLFMLLLFGSLVFQRVSRPEYLHFTLFLVAYVVSFALGSVLFLPKDGAPPAIQQVQAVFDALRAVAMIFLICSATEGRRGPVFWILVALASLLTLLSAVFPPLVYLRDVSTPEKVFFTVTGIYYLWASITATVRRKPEAPLILAGVLAYVAGTRLELFQGLNLRDLSTGFFSLCMVLALVVRHARLRANFLKLSASLLDAHEEERRRIARDLHDGIGQSLVALRLRLQMLDSRAKKGALEPEVFADLANDTLAILEDVRRTAMDLRPPYVESEGLLDLVKWYSSSFEEKGGVSVCVHDPEEGPGELEPRVKENLYRIFQEALSNAAKHSGASRVDVSVYRTGRNVRLVVSDDGKGFDPSQVEGVGLGMSTMRERAALLGGTLELRVGAGKGTTVQVEVPFT